jgi:hypothetical protein
VSERLVATLAFDTEALIVETDAETTVFDARLPSEAVETPLPTVTDETATGTKVVTVATGAKENKPIFLVRDSVKYTWLPETEIPSGCELPEGMGYSVKTPLEGSSRLILFPINSAK